MKNFKITNVQMICDNSDCDWVKDNIDISLMTDYINMPCPKCGENVFTFDDYEKTLAMLEVSQGLDELCGAMKASNYGHDEPSDKKVVGFTMSCSRDGCLSIEERADD